MKFNFRDFIEEEFGVKDFYFKVYPTGSRIIGGYTKDSDYDFIVPANVKDHVTGSLKGYFLAGDYTHLTYYAKSRTGKLINFIFADTRSDEYLSWVLATDILKELKIDWKDKAHRVETFSNIRSLIQGVKIKC